MNVNLVVIAGRCTKDPQLKYLANQTAVCELGVAVNEKTKDKEYANFFDVTAFGKTAEFIDQYFQKGKEIHIVGKLRYSAWEDGQGHKRSKVVVVADRVEFVGGKDGGTAAPRQPAQQPARQEFDERREDDPEIPF